MKKTVSAFRPILQDTGKARHLVPAVALAFLLLSQSSMAWAALPVLPSNPLLLPQLNLYRESGSSLSHLLALMGEGSAGAEGPSSSRLVFILHAPFTYNTNPALATSSSSPAWGSDPQVLLIHSAPSGGALWTQMIGADSAHYPEFPEYNLNTFSGQLQVNFTDQGLGFDSAPFLAYKTGFTAPADSKGHAWINDLETGVNFNRILGSGDGKDPLEVAFNLGLSQRWIQIDDGSGNSSTSGSTAFEIGIPFVYSFTSRLQLILDFSAHTRHFNVQQSPENEGRVDQVLNFPFTLGWTVIPDINLRIAAIQNFTQGFSSVEGQDVYQITTGVSLLAVF